MLVVHDSLEQTFVGVVFNELSSSGVTIAIQAEPNTVTDQCFDALFVGSGSKPPPGWRGIEQLSQHYCSVYVFSASTHIAWLWRTLKAHRDCPHLQITSRTCSLMDEWLVTVGRRKTDDIRKKMSHKLPGVNRTVSKLAVAATGFRKLPIPSTSAGRSPDASIRIWMRLW